MSRSTGMTMLLASLVAFAACKKDDDKKDETAKPTETTKASTTQGEAKEGATAQTKTDGAQGQTPTADPGVEAGGIERDKDEGPAAVITAVEGTVEVRRVGETEYAAAKADTQLYPGDQVRTGDKSTATITLADESVVEVAEVSSVGIASRDGSADPASGAAVLSGLARFTVTPRAPGEGAFKVYTPGGVVLTKGTTYAIGVAASGETRVGVESGVVDLVGLASVDADPIVVEAGNAATFTAEGSVGQPTGWATDDWGAWRAEADADAEAKAIVDAHGTALADIGAELGTAYADLDTAAESYAEFETKAATAAEGNATAEYEAVAPEGAATIEASFGVAGHIEALTWAYAGHAELAEAVYVRHPDEVKAEWEVVAPRVDAAVLWPKRFEVTAAAYLEPLRVQYYVHHPRGRAHAELVGVAVPQFYANVNVPEPEPAQVRARVRTHLWAEPVIVVKAQARPVWIAAPKPGWRAKVKVKAAPPRARVAWYVRPADVRTRFVYGADVKAKWTSRVKVAPPAPRASFRAKLRVPDVGMRIKIGPPNLDAAARARMKVKIGPNGVLVRDHRAASGGISGAAAAGADVKGGMDAKVKAGADVKVKVPDVKGGVDVKVRDHRDDVKGKIDGAAGAGADVKVKVRDHRSDVKAKVDGAAGAGADAKAKVKVTAPKVKVTPPKVKVKVKGEASGGFKIGK